jgi:hypothetical protein
MNEMVYGKYSFPKINVPNMIRPIGIYTECNGFLKSSLLSSILLITENWVELVVTEK